MSVAHFIGNLIWLGIALASVSALVDVSKSFRDKAVHAHQHDQIDRAQFTRMMTK